MITIVCLSLIASSPHLDITEDVREKTWFVSGTATATATNPEAEYYAGEYGEYCKTAYNASCHLTYT